MFQFTPSVSPGQPGRAPLRTDGAQLRSQPFAALPHHLAGDPTIKPTEKAVLLALLYWARAKAVCWPSDESIGKRVGRSAATVQRTLRGLEKAGLIGREKCTSNWTGRVIRLRWREGGQESRICTPVNHIVEADTMVDKRVVRDRPPRSIVTDPPPSRPTDKGDVSVQKETPKEKTEKPATPERQRPGPPAASPAPAPPLASPTSGPAVAILAALTPARSARLAELPASARDRALAWLASGDKICVAEAAKMLAPRPVARPGPATTAELLARLREDPRYPAMAAQAMASEFDDHKSWSGYLRLCERVWRGEVAVEAVLDGYRQACGGKVRNRGAVMNHVVGRSSRDNSCP